MSKQQHGRVHAGSLQCFQHQTDDFCIGPNTGGSKYFRASFQRNSRGLIALRVGKDHWARIAQALNVFAAAAVGINTHRLRGHVSPDAQLPSTGLINNFQRLQIEVLATTDQ